jgi:glycosyltransferase involved in cell wall biosynthesis
VGDGELRDQVESLINQYNLSSSFLITGWVDNPTAYMKIMDIGMLLSRWEGFGLVLPEYMACGVPIIATNVDAIFNIIKDGRNGLLVPKDNINEIVKATLLLHNNTVLRQELIENGFKDVKERFNIKRTVLETEEMYNKILI